MTPYLKACSNNCHPIYKTLHTVIITSSPLRQMSAVQQWNPLPRDFAWVISTWEENIISNCSWPTHRRYLVHAQTDSTEVLRWLVSINNINNKNIIHIIQTHKFWNMHDSSTSKNHNNGITIKAKINLVNVGVGHCIMSWYSNTCMNQQVMMGGSYCVILDHDIWWDIESLQFSNSESVPWVSSPTVYIEEYMTLYN